MKKVFLAIAMLLMAREVQATLYVNGFLATGNVYTNFPIQIWDDYNYSGTVYSINFGSNLLVRAISNNTAYVEGTVSGGAYTNTFTGNNTTGAVVGAGTATNKFLSQNGTWETDSAGVGGSSDPGFTDYFSVTLSATGMAAWTPSANTWSTGLFDTVRSNDQGVWKTNSYAFVFTSTGLVFVTTHLQAYHAVDSRYAYIFRNGVPYRQLSQYYTAVNNKNFDDGGTIIFENANATNIYSAVFLWETASGGSIILDGSSNSLYIIGGRFQ